MSSTEEITTVRLTLADAGQTRQLGELLGRVCRDRDVLLLQGDLGAGKTTLTGWIARGLGISEEEYVTSPTFSLLHEYSGRIPLYHMDCYRLSGEEDIEDAGLLDYIGSRGLCVIEWPDRLGSLTPSSCLEIYLQIIGEKERRVTLVQHGASWQTRLPELASEFNRIAGSS